MIAALCFYLFAAVAIASGVMVISARNPVHSVLFLILAFFMFAFLWVRATFPRFRYDQIMRLGWKVFIPITLIWITVIGVLMMEPVAHWPVIGIWFGK